MLVLRACGGWSRELTLFTLTYTYGNDNLWSCFINISIKNIIAIDDKMYSHMHSTQNTDNNYSLKFTMNGL